MRKKIKAKILSILLIAAILAGIFSQNVTKVNAVNLDAVTVDEPVTEASTGSENLSKEEISSKDIELPNEEEAVLSSQSVEIPEISMEELDAAAREDGSAAAGMVNEIKEEEAYLEALHTVLTIYYTEDYPNQLSAFTQKADGRAAEWLTAYAEAAAERANEDLNYQPGVLLVSTEVTFGLQAEQILDAVVGNEDGIIIQTMQDLNDTQIAVVELPLWQTVAAAQEAYADQPGVTLAQPEFLYERPEVTVTPVEEIAAYRQAFTLNDPLISEQYYRSHINVDRAWDAVNSNTGKRVRVGVIDTLAYTNHPDLKNVIDTNLSADFTEGYKRGITGLTPEDHGTHVAGIIGATVNNGVGIAGVGSGSNNQVVSILSLNVFPYKENGNGTAKTSSVILALNYAAETGCSVVNLSLGGYGNDHNLKNAIEATIGKGITVVASAGNDGVDRAIYPSDYQGVISVISSNKNGEKSSLSNYGDTKWITAPGTDILSTYCSGSGSGFSWDWAYMSGTSMAAPMVTATVAMMKYVNPSLQPEEIRTVLANTAKDMYSPGFDIKSGWGMVNAEVAVAAVSPHAPVTSISLSEKNISLRRGNQIQLAATVLPVNAQNRTVTWKSGNTKVATVSNTGLVKAVGEGTTDITITSIDGKKTASCRITVILTQTDRVDDFVTRFYEKVLGRAAGKHEIAYYTDALLSKRMTGADAGKGFVFSPEFKNKKLSNTAYIDTLYQSFMGRNADNSGKSYWKNMLDNGVSREYVFKGFVESPEFTGICSSYGISRGNVNLTEARDRNANLTMFISRCYEKALGRKAEVGGLNYYSEEILTKRVTPVQAAQNFIFSPEFKNKNLSNTEYVKVLYRTFMGREYDQSGLNYHLNRMKNGISREEILSNFAHSPEFKNIMSGFGL